jgi:hypothetical protein
MATATTQQVGIPQLHGNGWFVPSGNVGYYVERLEGRWRCCCPSFRWRKQGTCKHIQRVMVMTKEVTMG